MDKSFYIGSYKKDGIEGPNRGWIIGTFMADKPRKNEELEIKYWEFEKGIEHDHPPKTSSIIECTIILSGQTKAMIDAQEVILSAGDYIVIEPNTPNNLVAEILEDTSGLTIKAPSDPSAKTVIVS